MDIETEAPEISEAPEEAPAEANASLETPKTPPPTFSIFDDAQVAKIFPQGLPAIGETVTLTFSVSGISDRQGEDGGSRKSVDLQLTDSPAPAPSGEGEGEGELEMEEEGPGDEEEVEGTLSADEEEKVLGYKRPKRGSNLVPQVGDLKEL